MADKNLETLKDLLQFRIGTEEDENGDEQPVITTGSVVWGVLLRMSVIIVIAFVFLSIFEAYRYWWVFLFIIWFGTTFPGWKQYQIFQRRMKKLQESTLCGSCLHFDPTSQLCKLYDQHITMNYIPCEGLNWDPKPIDNEEE